MYCGRTELAEPSTPRLTGHLPRDAVGVRQLHLARNRQIDRSQLTMLDGSSTTPEGDIWYYANTQKRFPSKANPIVQSYVDVCLDGCLEIERMYALSKGANFAERFVRTTTNWGPPWINDRLYPWRPIIHVLRACR